MKKSRRYTATFAATGGLVILGLALMPARADSQQDVCTRTPDALTASRDAQADSVAKAYADASQSRIQSFRVSGEVCNWSCGMSPQSGRAQCTDRISHIAAYNCIYPGRQQGRAVTDTQYYADAEARWAGKGGPILEAPDWLVKASTDSNKTADFTAELRKRNVKYLDFSSTSIDNDGNSFRRVLVLIEGPNFDQWVQIATTPDGKTLSRNIDFIAFEKKDPATGKDLVTPNVYFKGDSRVPSSHAFLPEGGSGGSALTHCYACHSSGLRTVFPDPAARVTAFPGNALEYFQGLMARTPANMGPAPTPGGKPSYNAALDGPPMGADTTPDGTVRGPNERVAQIKANGCVAGLTSDASITRVAKAMSCASCHDGTAGKRGIINSGTDLTTLKHKIQGTGLHPRAYMPPTGKIDGIDGELTAPERVALLNCLQREYAGDLKTWLKATACSAPPAAVSCPGGTHQESTEPLQCAPDLHQVMDGVH